MVARFDMQSRYTISLENVLFIIYFINVHFPSSI